jgi:hypothetical protein
LEDKIGGGLIEEVIQVAEGELKLADILLKAKVYDSCSFKLFGSKGANNHIADGKIWRRNQSRDNGHISCATRAHLLRSSHFKNKYSTSRGEDVQYWRIVNRIYTVIGSGGVHTEETRFVKVQSLRY